MIYDTKCGDLTLKRLAECYWGLRMPSLLADLDRIHAELLKRQIVGSRARQFNDLDDAVWAEPHPTLRIVCHTDQNRNWLYVWPKENDGLSPRDLGGVYRRMGFRRLHCRFFYDVLSPNPTDSYEKERDQEFKQKVKADGRAGAVLEADELTRYADDAYAYPERHSLQYYRDNGFNMKYGDARDGGYVFSWDEAFERVDDAIHHHQQLSLIEGCMVPSLLYTLLGEREEEEQTVEKVVPKARKAKKK